MSATLIPIPQPFPSKYKKTKPNVTRLANPNQSACSKSASPRLLGAMLKYACIAMVAINSAVVGCPPPANHIAQGEGIEFRGVHARGQVVRLHTYALSEGSYV